MIICLDNFTNLIDTPSMPLNPQSPIPLYRQLADRLAADIRAGLYAAGDRIPSEHALAQEYALGRPTVRQAIDTLARKGLLIRRRGSGTYVCEPRPEVDLFSLEGTGASFQKTGLRIEISLISPPRLTAAPKSHDNPFGGRRALHLMRLTRNGGVPVLLEDIYMDGELFEGLENIDLSGQSLSRIAEERFHLRPTGARQRFRIAYAVGERAHHLRITPQTPVLFVQRHLHFPHRRDGVYVELWCRGDQFVFSQTIGGIEDA
jgi:GntR family transcriptional regulator